jgi:alpha-galactosidase
MEEIEQKVLDKMWFKIEEEYGSFLNDWFVVEEYFYTALDQTNELHW